jgi:hypothetical protein
LVDEVVGLIQSLVDPTLPLESEVDTTHVFLVTSDSSRQGGISTISMKPLQVLRSFSLIGIGWQSLAFLPACLSKSLCKFAIRSYITLLFMKKLLSAFYPKPLGKIWLPLSLCQLPIIYWILIKYPVNL